MFLLSFANCHGLGPDGRHRHRVPERQGTGIRHMVGDWESSSITNPSAGVWGLAVAAGCVRRDLHNTLLPISLTAERRQSRVRVSYSTVVYVQYPNPRPCVNCDAMHASK